MIYLSVQPDDFYFLWQVKLLVNNLKSLGVASSDIHVIFVFKKKKGLSKQVKDWIEENRDATYFPYADDRLMSAYPSSVRPYVIYKHFKTFPFLKKSAIFYHDSDILFNSNLTFLEDLEKDDYIYASDTESYTGLSIIKQLTSENMVEEMCSTITVDYEKIRDLRMGGAQYLLKNLDENFWYELYENCENMFSYLVNKPDIKKNLEIWSTDMWCLWWMLADKMRKIAVHPELDFYWADSAIEHKKKRKNITHYTGMFNSARDSHIFIKSNYINTSPFDADLSRISDSNASIFVVKEINKYISENCCEIVNISDLSILMCFRVFDSEMLMNIISVCNFLKAKTNAKIVLVEVDSTQKINLSLIKIDVEYHFVKDGNDIFDQSKYIDQFINFTETPYVCIYDGNYVLAIDQIEQSLKILRERSYDIVLPYNGTVFTVNNLYKKLFYKSLDVEYLKQNESQCKVDSYRSVGSIQIFSKEAYFNAGGKNRNIGSSHLNDLEQLKRMETLGYFYYRTEGAIYKLSHSKDSSQIITEKIKTEWDEYLKVCSMDKNALKKYITDGMEDLNKLKI